MATKVWDTQAPRGRVMKGHFEPGDFVIYRKRKYSVHPGPHARDIFPAPAGKMQSVSAERTPQ